MFATLSIEYQPWTVADVPGWIVTWLQDVGGFAAFFLLLWLLVTLVRMLLASSRGRTLADWFDPLAGSPLAEVRGRGAWGLLATLLRFLFAAAVVGTFLVYAVLGLARLPEAIQAFLGLLLGRTPVGVPLTHHWEVIQNIGLTVAGACAVLAVGLPFLVNLFGLRTRRIWALTRLTIKEILRKQVLWGFLLLGVVFLFAAWFISSKSPYQLALYVQVVYFAMTVLLLVTGSLVASFSIPTDIKQQTIHTVLTKPVQRYEIFLGRFFGYVGVLTVVLVLMTGFSLLYVLRELSPEAQYESLRARVPVYGALTFENTGDPNKGTNVGDEWEYRTYIAGPFPGQLPQYAIWSFPGLPRDLGQRPEVPVEFTFNIYRTTTGELNKGVFCSFEVESWRCLHNRKDEYRNLHKSAADPELDRKLAGDFGYYEVPSKEIVNYHTQAIEVPAEVFRLQVASREQLRPRLEELRKKQQDSQITATEADELALLERDARGEPRPPLQIRVRCLSRTQFLGMAKYDLYVLGAERSFYNNFFKGALGIWLWMCLTVALALACSTYMSGVISWLCVLFLFLTGWSRDYVHRVSLGLNEGGGPAESLLRLFNRQSAMAPLEKSTVTHVASVYDESFRWLLRRVIDILPDVQRFDFSDLVANGFNVPGTQLALTLLFLAGYLLPWVVLAYYLIRSREVASST